MTITLTMLKLFRQKQLKIEGLQLILLQHKELKNKIRRPLGYSQLW